MGQTPRYALPYPELGDTPDVPRDVKALALRLDELLLAARVTRHSSTITKSGNIPYNVAGFELATIDIADPGYPFFLSTEAFGEYGAQGAAPNRWDGLVVVTGASIPPAQFPNGIVLALDVKMSIQTAGSWSKCHTSGPMSMPSGSPFTGAVRLTWKTVPVVGNGDAVFTLYNRGFHAWVHPAPATPSDPWVPPTPEP